MVHNTPITHFIFVQTFGEAGCRNALFEICFTISDNTKRKWFLIFLENVINKITAFIQILAGCNKQKVLKSVLGEAISTEFDKATPLCLETISNYSNAMERQGHSSGNTVAVCLFAKNPHSRTWIEVKLFVSCTVRIQRLLSHRSTIILLLQ